ncbi:hypothetical protein AMATHDRAFT_66220 [Amanita thiersii Skay4041]|uniref:Cyanovirin-N domain-containing protein n=1 Tax=Amanita thiersii Skay4041 TaxID=703135 RepID=A0A2A9NK93_9AGAR|nr:hypothetical protein AMATHDRAFT_66220 [Amanita thiersii Skay4041]
MKFPVLAVIAASGSFFASVSARIDCLSSTGSGACISEKVIKQGMAWNYCNQNGTKPHYLELNEGWILNGGWSSAEECYKQVDGLINTCYGQYNGGIVIGSGPNPNTLVFNFCRTPI